MATRLAEIMVMYENNESLCCIPRTDNVGQLLLLTVL